MDIKHLEGFRKLPIHQDLIEMKDKRGHRWLFATDGIRAIGFKTNELVSHVSSNKAQHLQEYLDRDNFIDLNRQRFMAWLHSGEELSTCLYCEGCKKVACDTCDGNGTFDCDDCNGDGVVEDECEECGGSGTKNSDCEDCDGNGTVEGDCNDCSGSGKVEEDCPDCGGHGVEDADADPDKQIKCKNCNGDGTVEVECEECCEGIVENECNRCDGYGTTEKDCEDCSYGNVERDCDNCNGSGQIDCEECDDDFKQPCSDCEDDPKDIGDIYGHKIDLGLIKDLSMDHFDEVSISSPPGEDPIIFRGEGVLAIVMPYRNHDKFRTYEPGK